MRQALDRFHGRDRARSRWQIRRPCFAEIWPIHMTNAFVICSKLPSPSEAFPEKQPGRRPRGRHWNPRTRFRPGRARRLEICEHVLRLELPGGGGRVPVNPSSLSPTPVWLSHMTGNAGVNPVAVAMGTRQMRSTGGIGIDRRSSGPSRSRFKTDVGFQLQYQVTGLNERAIQELSVVLAENSAFPLAHFWRGRVYGAEHRCQEALDGSGSVGPALQDWQPVLAARGINVGQSAKKK